MNIGGTFSKSFLSTYPKLAWLVKSDSSRINVLLLITLLNIVLMVDCIFIFILILKTFLFSLICLSYWGIYRLKYYYCKIIFILIECANSGVFLFILIIASKCCLAWYSYILWVTYLLPKEVPVTVRCPAIMENLYLKLGAW